jgi:hypothetical protein
MEDMLVAHVSACHDLSLQLLLLVSSASCMQHKRAVEGVLQLAMRVQRRFVALR